MLQMLVSGFVQVMFLAAVATLVGRYVGRKPKHWPSPPSGKALLFLQVWVVTFIAQAAGYYLSGLIGLDKDSTEIGMAFLLPIAVGALYAHTLLSTRLPAR